jgi:hypothetical protein
MIACDSGVFHDIRRETGERRGMHREAGRRGGGEARGS